MDWLKVYSAACAVRDADSARVLAEIPPEVVRRSKRVLRYDEFNQLLFEGLAALHRNDSSCRDTLLRARELAQPEHAKLSPAWADYGGLPTIELALTLVDGDAAAFNRALVHALEKHKGYWSSNAKGQGVPRRDDVDGFLALPALGLACVAHDRGMTIDVESGYMPAWIVEGAGG